MPTPTKIESRYLLASAAIALAAVFSIASPVFAADAPAAAAPTPQDASKCAASAASDNEPQTGTRIHRDCEATRLDTVMVFGGAELRPGESQWSDDDASAPELPMTRDHGISKR